MNNATLTIDIRGYWHPGTGRGSGFHLDAVTHEGADGLPRLPGRTLKGLLRDAVLRAEHWGWAEVPAGSTERLFGPLGRDGAQTRPGLLRVADATLPADVGAWLSQTQEGRDLVPGLYSEHFSTAIEHDSGVARPRSLRGMRVVVPLTLEAEVAEVPGVPAPEGDWRSLLQAVFPLIPAVGAHRTRGFGRAVLAWKGTRS
jgi:hypothetical protein